jgi:hypothetical protein
MDCCHGVPPRLGELAPTLHHAIQSMKVVVRAGRRRMSDLLLCSAAWTSHTNATCARVFAACNRGDSATAATAVMMGACTSNAHGAYVI